MSRQGKPLPSASVILPVRDGEATVGEAVVSVLAQTHRELELIVIDDGSRDRTLDVLAGIDDHRLEVHSTPRSGPSASRNRGIARAASELVAFIDADDIWLPSKLSAQVDALRAAPDAAVAYCWTDYVDPAGRYVCPDSRPRFEGDVHADLLAHNFIDSGSNIVARRKRLLEVGGFDESLPVVEDWDLYLRLAARHRFVCVPSALVQYCQSSTSLTNRISLMEECFWRVVERSFGAAPETFQRLKPHSVAAFYLYLTGKATYDCPSRSNGLAALGFFIQAVRHRPPSLLALPRQSWLVKALLKAILSVVLPAPAMRWGVDRWPSPRHGDPRHIPADGSEAVA